MDERQPGYQGGGAGALSTGSTRRAAALARVKELHRQQRAEAEALGLDASAISLDGSTREITGVPWSSGSASEYPVFAAGSHPATRMASLIDEQTEQTMAYIKRRKARERGLDSTWPSTVADRAAKWYNDASGVAVSLNTTLELHTERVAETRSAIKNIVDALFTIDDPRLLQQLRDGTGFIPVLYQSLTTIYELFPGLPLKDFDDSTPTGLARLGQLAGSASTLPGPPSGGQIEELLHSLSF